MLRFALRYFDQKKFLSSQFSVIVADANGRSDCVSADLDQNSV